MLHEKLPKKFGIFALVWLRGHIRPDLICERGEGDFGKHFTHFFGGTRHERAVESARNLQFLSADTDF